MKSALITVILLAVANGAKILVVFPMASHSHFTLGFRLAKELADRGHNVTFINAFPQQKPIKNLRDISVTEIIDGLRENRKELFGMDRLSYLGQLHFAKKIGLIYSKLTLENQGVQELLKSDEKFDLVLYEHFWSEALMIFGHKFNCPIVVLVPLGSNVFSNYLIANPTQSNYIPNLLTHFTVPMGFWQRLANIFYDVVGEFFMYNVILPEHDALLKKMVPNVPDLKNFIYNGSLMLLCSHPSFSDPYPLQPAVKEIGGYHVSPPKPLPKDIQEFLNGAKDGAIIFSMGSNLVSAAFPKHQKDAIIRVFSRIKQRVLWKYEEDLPGIPKNVKIIKWLPQQDTLAHPKVIGLISHVGLLSITEAVYHGVPVLGLPVFWDQERNTDDAVRRGFAIKIPFPELNEGNFEWALTELVNNPKYRENAKMRSRIMHDQPTKPLDEGIYWIEYVIRHKGASHLRSNGLDLKWYQRYFLDIILFLLLVMSIPVLMVLCVCKRIFRTEKVKDKRE